MAQGKWVYAKALPVLVAINDLIRLLPAEYQWSCEITDDTGTEVPAVFNIYVTSENERINLRGYLKKGLPYEETDTTEYHRYSHEVTVGIIEI